MPFLAQFKAHVPGFSLAHISCTGGIQPIGFPLNWHGNPWERPSGSVLSRRAAATCTTWRGTCSSTLQAGRDRIQFHWDTFGGGVSFCFQQETHVNNCEYVCNTSVINCTCLVLPWPESFWLALRYCVLVCFEVLCLFE